MFMQRIEIPVTAKRRRPLALKFAAGLGFCLVAAAVMPPYLAAVAIWVALAAGARLLLRAASTLWHTVIHAGELVVGR